jgi:predicted dehydrogenase
MRRDPAKAADYARRHGVAKWYDDAQKLIDDPQVDAVYIATPPGMHETYAMQVCAAGKPCYVEKPMTRNSSEARRMIEAFSQRGVPLFVAYYRRGLPRFIKAKQIIESGTLGEIRTAIYAHQDSQMLRRTEPVPWRLIAEHAGGGLFLDIGSHVLDILDFFLGPLQNVAGRAKSAARQYPVEDQVELTFTAAGNVSGHVSFNFAGDHREEGFVIRGTAHASDRRPARRGG